MKILILNGNPDGKNAEFEDYLEQLTHQLRESGHETSILVLREMDIRYCIGCFGCWIKTPGECIAKDDSRTVCREYINSDSVVFASPVIMGFTSGLLKKANDKLIPLLMPYTGIFEKEIHHVSRYEKYPSMSVLVQPESTTYQDDLKIIADIYRRETINFKAHFSGIQTTDEPVEEVANAITGS